MAYADQVKDAKKKDVRVTIETSDNGGVIVRCSWSEDMPKPAKGDGCYPSSQYKDKTYVYDSLDEALKDIPSMISVKQDMDPSDDIDRKMMSEED